MERDENIQRSNIKHRDEEVKGDSERDHRDRTARSSDWCNQLSVLVYLLKLQSFAQKFVWRFDFHFELLEKRTAEQQQAYYEL